MAKKKIQKEPVRLREQVLADGSRSLYLDIYRKGKRKREYLKLYLVKEKNPFDKEQNRQTLATAQAIKAKRQIELQNGEYSFTKQKQTDLSVTVLSGYLKYCDEHRKGANPQGTYNCWHGVYTHLKEYCDKDYKVVDIDEEWIQGFIDYLDTTCLKRNNLPQEGTKLGMVTKFNYIRRFIAFLNKACDDGLIDKIVLKNLPQYERPETKKNFLTVEELQKLTKTPCKYPALRSAFLFSCLTGLRVSDVRKLTWGEMQKFGNFHRIVFKQKKTGGLEYLDINEQAYALMGKRGNPEDRYCV